MPKLACRFVKIISMTAVATVRHLKVYNKQDVLSLTRLRRFETKLGERIKVINNPEDLDHQIATSDAKFVLFGVPEDLGAKGNYGIGGADTLWIPFLQSFLNVQSNDFLDGQEILLVGHFDFGDIQYLIDTTAKGEEEKIAAYRHAAFRRLSLSIELTDRTLIICEKSPGYYS